MTGTCRRLLVAAHRWLFATLTLLGSIQRAVHSWLDHHPHAAFLKSWHGWPVPAPPPVAPAKPGPIYPPPSPVYAIGTYQAGTVLWPLPAAAAQAMLPEGLVQARRAFSPPGSTPPFSSLATIRASGLTSCTCWAWITWSS